MAPNLRIFDDLMDTQAKPTILCIMGPTASGKTQLACHLAQRLKIQLISVDSAQVYCGLDIGSGKPTQQELIEFPHELIDICQPSQPYSAYEFRQDAMAVIEKAQEEGKLPCLVGGTMLYFRTLLQGLANLPSADQEVRQKIEMLAAEHGWPMVHQTLTQIDPATASRLHPTDAQRVSRALEVYYTTGIPLSDLIKVQVKQILPFEPISIGILPEANSRSRLHRQIEKRFDKMMATGLVEEVEGLMQSANFDENLPAYKSVGYRQVIAFLQKQYDKSTMQEKAYAATRQLAKRQMTWLRQWEGLERFDCFADTLLDDVMAYLPKSILATYEL